jgi:tetratricopeptide (TPR) repeat protein
LLRQAIAAQSAGRLAEAEALCRRLLAREPQNLSAKHLRAIVAAMRGNSALAMGLLREVLVADPVSVGALNQLAHLCWPEGKTEEAIALCTKALRLAPTLAETSDNLGMAYIASGKHREAAAAFAQAIALKPDLGQAHCHLAIARELQGEPQAGATVLQQAFFRGQCTVDGAAIVLRQIGQNLQHIGRFDDAASCFQRAIAVQPLRTAPYLDMIYGMKVREQDRSLISKISDLVRDPRLNEIGRANLHFALGKAFDDLGQFGVAITHFDEANRLRQGDQKFSRIQHLKTIEWLESEFTKGFCERNSKGASYDETPVFVLGMPRSGTTLVEQILSRHPEIGGGGELLFWGEFASSISPNFTDLKATAVSAIADEYLRVLAAIAPGAQRVTDKMPSNLFRLGLIHHIFPHARFIHCRRNPADTCLSIYFTQFSTGHEWAYDRGNIVCYYEQYARLMAHWRRVLPPGRMLEIDYEELVSDPESVSRRMVTFCGLAWNDSCLRLDSDKRPVKTASMWQSRQPIYTSSRARWRNYEAWLGEFRNLIPVVSENGNEQ